MGAGRQGDQPLLERVEKRVSQVFSLVVKFGISLLVLVLLLILWEGFYNDDYAVKPFSVPQELRTKGYDGMVAANRMVDQLQRIKKQVASIKEDHALSNEGSRPSMSLSMMGFGFSMESVVFHLKELFGKGTNYVEGELTHMDDSLHLKLRLTGYPPYRVSRHAAEGEMLAALEEVSLLAAQHILRLTDPYRLALYHRHKGDHEAAMKVIHHIIEHRQEEKIWAYHAWALVLRDQKRHQASIDMSRYCLSLDNEFRLAWNNLASMYEQVGQPDSSVMAIKKVMEYDPDNMSLYRWYAWGYYRAKRYEEALAICEQAVEKAPRNIEMYAMWTQMLANMGRLDKALEVSKRAYEIDPDHPSSLMLMSHVKSAEGDSVASRTFLHQALEISPDNWDILFPAAFAALHNKEYALSHRLFRRRLDIFPRDQIALNGLGVLYYREKQIDSALTYVSEAIAVDSSANYPYASMAEIQAFLGKDEAFYRYFEMALERGLVVASISSDLFFDETNPLQKYLKEPRFGRLVNKYGQKLPIKK